MNSMKITTDGDRHMVRIIDVPGDDGHYHSRDIGYGPHGESYQHAIGRAYAAIASDMRRLAYSFDRLARLATDEDYERTMRIEAAGVILSDLGSDAAYAFMAGADPHDLYLRD